MIVTESLRNIVRQTMLRMQCGMICLAQRDSTFCPNCLNWPAQLESAGIIIKISNHHLAGHPSEKV